MKKTLARAAVALTATVLIFAGAVPASAAVAGIWSPLADLSEAGFDANYPQIQYGVAGNAIAIWQRFDGEFVRVQARSSHDFGATWDPVVNLSAAGEGARWGKVGIDAAGNAIAIWQRFDGSNWIVQARSSRDAGVTWDPVVNLSTAGEDSDPPHIGFDAAGNAIAIWSRFDGEFYRVQARSSRDAGATWDPVVNLSAAGHGGFNARISSYSAGKAIAIWELFGDAGVSIQTSASRDGGATWSTPKNLSSPSPRALNPQISADSAGNAIAIWYLQGPSLAEHVQIRASSDGGDTWNSAVDLSDGKGAYWPRIDLDAAGNAIAIWEHDDSNGKSTVKARSSRDVGATWNPEVNLSAAAAVGAPEISFGFAGYAIAIWMSFDGAGWSIQTSASRDAGANWDSVVDLTAAGQSEFFPQISADASGNAIAVWWTEGVDDVIQTSWLAAPALPDTGAKASVIGTSTAIAAGLLAAGALALIMVRRRRARE